MVLCFIAQAQINFLTKSKSFNSIDSSIYYAEKQLEQNYSLQNNENIIETSVYLISQYNNKSLYEKSKKIIFKSLSIEAINKNEVQKALLLLELGNTYKYESDYVSALNTYLVALKLLEKNKAWKNCFKAKIDLAEYFRRIGNYPDATLYIKDALTLYTQKKLVDTIQLIRFYGRFAAIKNETNCADSSIYYTKKALSLCFKVNDRYTIATCYNELGYSYKNILKNDSSELYYKKAEIIFLEIGANREAVSAIKNRIELYSHNSVDCKRVINQSLNLLSLINDKKIDVDISNIYLNIHTKYIELNDSSKALVYYRKFHQSSMDEIYKKREIEIQNIKEKYENDKIKKEITQVSFDLSKSTQLLEQKNRENTIIYLSLGLLSILLILIVYLFYQNRIKNATLVQKNKEQDGLIQEIHHRVKNNLQFVSSLINMQINSSTNSNDVDALNEASRRIRAMALVHEMLYNQHDLKGVLIKQYLEELIKSITDLVNSKNLEIKFKLDIVNFNFDTTRSIALGMITSELVSNSIKYAFTNTLQPQINISLKHLSNNKIEFSIKDNGKGIEQIKEDQKKLGMRLINIFSRQLKGDFTFENNNGLIYRVIFKI